MRSCPIIIVSGLPRSGTSLMMQMLEAGGLAALTDGIRRSDASNPKGYYELEAVKQTRENAAWLDQAGGKCVKMISMLLYDLPPTRKYKIVFMARAMEEVLASQAAMMEKLAGDPFASFGRKLRQQKVDGAVDKGPTDAEMRRYYEIHLQKLEKWLKEQGNIEVKYCEHKLVLERPEQQAREIQQFLGVDLDIAKMAAAVDSSLYRQRRQEE